MKNNLHILLFCENDSNLLEQKQTGLFAIDLVKKGFDVSIMVNNYKEVSQLETIYKKIKVYYTTKRKWYQKHIDFYEFNIKRILKKDPSIDIVQVMFCNYENAFIGKACSKLSIPCITKIYHKGLREFRVLNKFKKNNLRNNLSKFSKVVVSADYLIGIGKRFGLSNITLIYDGIYTDSLKGSFNKKPIRDKLSLPDRSLLITCIANVTHENKQFDILDKIMPLSSTRQLVLVGRLEDKMLQENIKREADFKNVSEFVHFVGSKSDYISYLKASDLFVLLGGIEDRVETVLQAQALGIPVILGESPSSLFLTNASRNGIVLYEDNVLVQQSLDRLLTDGLYRQSRAVNAREFVMDLFSRDKMLEDYIKLYKSL
ncbi:MAG: glycosyltransferase family 4 protein [Proteobacteria bacterium]|nr:glycosyltransferase family 4 protein [Pseudomonadota bacterium]